MAVIELLGNSYRIAGDFCQNDVYMLAGMLLLNCLSNGDRATVVRFQQPFTITNKGLEGLLSIEIAIENRIGPRASFKIAGLTSESIRNLPAYSKLAKYLTNHSSLESSS